MSHRIDVLMPAYNAATTITIAVESLLAQTVRDIEVHIVNDGSTDDTGAVAEALAARDSRVHVHHQANGGIVDALNAGLEHCRAEFLGRLDADDTSYPDRFERQLAFLAAHPDVVGVGGAVRHIDIDGVPIGSVARIGSPDRADAAHVPCIEPYIVHSTLLARRSAVAAVGGYRQVYYAEDTDLFWRLKEVGRLYNMTDILGDYRFHAGSVSGLSIVNGRIMSISSQLTGLSVLRRARGVPDIYFYKASIDDYRKAETLTAMVEVASTQLTPDERRHFEEAVAGKLMELTAYRPYELQASDCDYIGMIARRGFSHLNEPNRGLQIRRISGAAARIAAAGQLRNATRMLPPSFYPKFSMRTFARVALPERLWRMVRRGGTDVIFK